ncbi:MAG: hypothetical protein FJW30_12245, partial [Acidobacteria bacterium]|nr:hypothetical protein [Acidobacteriota bacterium]
MSTPETDLHLGQPAIGPHFRFAQWISYTVSSLDPESWSPNPKPYARSKRRYQNIYFGWVYLFQNCEGNIRWYGEYRVLNDEIATVDLTDARDLERDERPAPGPYQKTIHVANTVAAEENGTSVSREVTYHAYLSRMRLPIDAVKQLQLRANQILPHTRLKPEPEDNNAEFSGFKPHYLFPEPDGHLVFCAVDPLSIAESLALQYGDACDSYLEYVTAAESMPEHQRKQVTDRQSKMCLGETILGLLEQQPELETQLEKGGKANIRAFLDSIESTRVHLLRQAMRRSVPLCYWLRGELFEIAQQSHFVFAEKDAAEFLEIYSTAVERLMESDPGVAYLSHVLLDKGHFVHAYVIPQSEMGATEFQVARKSWSSTLNILEKLSLIYLRKTGTEGLKLVVATVGRLTRIPVVADVRMINSLMVIRLENVEARVVKFHEVAAVKGGEDYWQQWAGDGTKGAKVIARVGMLFEAVNLYLAFDALKTAKLDAAGLPVMVGYLGSVADTVAAGATLLGIWKRAIPVIGLFSAICDTACAAVDVRKMAARNDYSAMAGQAIICTGSAAFAISFGLTIYSASVQVAAAAAAAAAGAGVTVVGFVPATCLLIAGAVLVAAGWFTLWLSSESDIELWMSHCEWGHYRGQGTEKPGWATAAYEDWKGDFAVQLQALMTLLSQFHIAAASYDTVRI